MGYKRMISKWNAESAELYDSLAGINRVDQAIYESEQEMANGAEARDTAEVFAELERKYYG